MTSIDDLKPGLKLRGVIPNESVSIIDAQRRGSSAVELVYKRADGQVASQLVFKEDAAKYEVAEDEQRWDFSADGSLFRLAAEAYRIHLAHLFDERLAVHTSLIEPLPHQITGVYGEMLPRQPLKFLLADDPGAGKTIMAGLLIKELRLRGDVQRCLICVPGNLAAQWQDELWFKFQTRFEILTRDRYETSASGNAFLEHDLAIIRLDQVARDEELKEQLARSEWDLVIVDEAHKMSAHYWGGELEETKRYKLGKLLRDITRHFLLMTATPHNGKEEDFQLFLKLLDEDRFEGRFREGVHQVDISDLMRRMVKEDLVRFDGRPLFPERKAYTVSYPLSSEERELYEEVTTYVQEEFNRADQLTDDKRRGTVGFALTILQRRLASSPEAIYKSLMRRRERLEARIIEIQAMRQGVSPALWNLRYFDEEELDYFDDVPAEEAEEIEEEVLDAATAALTIEELEAEIETLKGLEAKAYRLRRSGADHKWKQLATILQDESLMFDGDGRRRKLVIFTEHRDTLSYLQERITTLFGRQDEMMVTIHGSVPRAERRAIEDRFRNDPDVYFLLATDAAAEGINLQRAHLMINYDLPWNPNRLEQRFGRIHRIGQTEVCHLWNLVAGETREGYVYERLLRKIETESHALQGKVFDVLGNLFEQEPLRKLLIDAIRYGDQPEVKAKLEKSIDEAVDQDRVRELLEARSLATDTMDTTQILHLREEMERYAAQRLQPHHIKSFFMHAFEMLGGKVSPREPGRYTIRYVPARIRNHAKSMGSPVPVWEKYDRICFDKELMTEAGVPDATFVCPGHPLMDSVVDLVLNKYRNLLGTGTVLVDPADPTDQPRALVFLEQRIQDARELRNRQRTISQEVHFVELDREGALESGGHAPYLDYRPASSEEEKAISIDRKGAWLSADFLDDKVIGFAVEELIPRHIQRIRSHRLERIEKTKAAVHKRLTKEINYWDLQVAQLREAEKEGKPNAAVNRVRAEQRAEELAARLERRMRELEGEKEISAAPPVVVGGALIIPAGMLYGPEDLHIDTDRRITEQIAMKRVMEDEIRKGNHPKDVSADKVGYDIESFDPKAGVTRFIEVKGRKAGADTIDVYRSEVITGLNSPDRFLLAIAEIDDGQVAAMSYLKEPFSREPDFGATSVTYRISDLMNQSMIVGGRDRKV